MADNYTDLERMLLQFLYASKTLLRPNCEENVTLLKGADQMIEFAKDIDARRKAFQHDVESYSLPGLRGP